MSKRVLSVGQCGPDNASLSRLIEGRFGARMETAQVARDSLEKLRSGGFDLVLVNRKLDADYTDGIEVIRQIKGDASLAETPCMLVSNYADAQDAAIALGAERGFGKLELNDPATADRLTPHLGDPVAAR